MTLGPFSSVQMTQPNQLSPEVQRNIAVHDRIAAMYEKTHGEIFNDREQSRLHDLLSRAVGTIETGRSPIRALDMGCGSGNLTSHLLDLGAEVTAADVSTGFLRLVESRHSGKALQTHQLNGRDLLELADGSFDLVATYSVLHHIPDYLAACREMARVCSKGGVIVIDHEASPNVWQGDELLARFQREGSLPDWRKFLTPANYWHRLRRVFDPKHSNEGDIHVWADDHIEWNLIEDAMAAAHCEPVISEDYLLFRRQYRPEVYDRYRDRCTDTRAMVFRRMS